MIANIFSEEYIFFSDFLNHIFLLGIVLKKHRANLSDAAKERVLNLIHTALLPPRPSEDCREHSC
jgi:hypothetical protein